MTTHDYTLQMHTSDAQDAYYVRWACEATALVPIVRGLVATHPGVTSVTLHEDGEPLEVRIEAGQVRIPA